jgi:hypothetical protein
MVQDSKEWRAPRRGEYEWGEQNYPSWVVWQIQTAWSG